MRAFLLALLCGAAVVANAAAADRAEPVLKISEEQQRALGIETQVLEERAAAASDVWNAHTQFSPDAEWVVTALLPGTVQRWVAVPGQAVHKGDTLAIVHSDAAVALQREYLAARAQSQLDAAALKRDENLYRNGVIAERRWLETRARAQQQALHVSALHQQLLLAGFNRDDLRLLALRRQLRPDYPLRAPADAVVVERRGELGERVQAMAPLFRLGDPQKIWLLVKVPARYIKDVREGDALQIVGGGTARVRFVNSAVDARTQTFSAMAALDGQPSYPAGALVQVRRLGAGGLRVPSSALVRYGDGEIVFVRVAGGFVARAIEAATAADGAVVVRSGLQPGERIAISGVAALKGMLVGMGGGE